MKIHEKLEKFASREIEKLQHNLIVVDSRGVYTVFGRYRVCPENQNYVVRITGQNPLTFGSKKSAISWCVADKYRQHNLARNIWILDQKKTILSADIECRTRLANQSRNYSFREAVQTKLEPKILHLNAVRSELEKCVNSAKYWQIRGFSNETNRPGRT